MTPVFSLKAQDQRILVEQVKVLYQSLLLVLLISLVAGSALLYGLWDAVSHSLLITWMCVLVIVVALRISFYFFSYRRHFKPQHAHRHGLHSIIGSAATALIWGVGGVVLFPEHDLAHQVFILSLLIGMGAGSMSSLTAYLPTFIAYFPISILPISILFILIGDPIHLSLGLMTVIYIAALLYFGLNINRAVTQSLKLRFENIDLVAQLREQKNEAEQADIAKSKFLAAASHDLRQPLHALTLFTSVLDESIQYPKVRKVVDQIKSSVHALQNLFNALLDISRLDAGVMKVVKSDFNLQSLLKKLTNDFIAQAKDKGLQIHCPDCPYAVHTDPHLLEQILRNYISNAIRYTDNGEIKVTCEAGEGTIMISVSDTGRGIPEQEQDIIFEEFHQLGNPERDRSKGLGLGLAIVQRTAKLLGHSIAIESQPGTGSTFSITVNQADSVGNVNVAAPELEDDSPPAKGPLVIVIDDEASVREGMHNLLELWNYTVITAADKDEAIAQLKQQDRIPAGIIADYRLRDNHTGVEAIHALRAQFDLAIPALIVTGDIAPERLREVNDSGLEMLHKPVAPAKLRAFLRHLRFQT